jgi:hypothetical protein
MVKKKVFWTVWVTSIVLFITACTFEPDISSSLGDTRINRENQERLSNIPFENVYVLRSFADDPQILYFETARRIALVEFLATEFDVDMGWEGYRMLPIPVVIYGFDNRPRLYDFIVVDAEEQVSGTITVHARRASPTSIRAVRHGVRDYRSVLSRASFEASLFEDWRGSSFLGLRGRAGDVPNLVMCAATGERVTGMAEPESGEEKVAILLNDELYMRMLTDTGGDEGLSEMEIGAKLLAAHGWHATQADGFWSLIMDILPEIELIEYEDGLADADSRFVRAALRRVVRVVVDLFNGNIRNIDSRTFLDRYTNYPGSFRANEFDWCGPWVVAYLEWIRSGRTRDSYGVALLYTSRVLGHIFSGKPMTPWALSVSLLHVSSGRMFTGCKPYFDRLAFYNQIRYRQRPVVVLTWKNTPTPHWELIVGARRTGHLLWQSYHFLLHDNNTRGMNWIAPDGIGRHGNGLTEEFNGLNRRYNDRQYRELSWLYPGFMVYGF